MESLEIAKEYYSGVKKLIGEITMVLYGSTVFGVNTSDLDLCFFREQMLPKYEFEKLKNFTHDFHVSNNLRIDEEVPYDNKLIYTHDFIESTLTNPPFPRQNNKIIVPQIQKSHEFLNSIEMKKRLLLNILTVKHAIIGKDCDLIDSYIDRAWEVMLKTVISYSEKEEFSFQEILECLYEDPFNKNSGEMYLGYKTNLQAKMDFIEEQVDLELDRLIDENKIQKTLTKKYIPNRVWLNK